MSFFSNISGFNGNSNSSIDVPNFGSNDLGNSSILTNSLNPQLNDINAQTLQALQQNGQAAGELLSSGMDANMPDGFENLEAYTNTALYNALSPSSVNSGNINQYASQLEQGLFSSDLTSPQSMADMARSAELFSGL